MILILIPFRTKTSSKKNFKNREDHMYNGVPLNSGILEKMKRIFKRKNTF